MRFYTLVIQPMKFTIKDPVICEKNQTAVLDTMLLGKMIQ